MGYRLLPTRILTFSSHHSDMELPACSGVASCFGDSSFAVALLRRTEALPGYGGLRPDERRDGSPSRVVNSRRIEKRSKLPLIFDFRAKNQHFWLNT
jgi:hypothetical protein